MFCASTGKQRQSNWLLAVHKVYMHYKIARVCIAGGITLQSITNSAGWNPLWVQIKLLSKKGRPTLTDQLNVFSGKFLYKNIHLPHYGKLVCMAVHIIENL